MKIYLERTNKRIISLSPQSDGSVRVIAYKTLSKSSIEQHIKENYKWLVDAMNNIGVQSEQPSRIDVDVAERFALSTGDLQELHCGRTVMLYGNIYQVCSSAKRQTTVDGRNVYISEQYFSEKEQRLKTLKSYLKKVCRAVLPQAVSKIAVQFALCPTKIEFKDLRERWCSCSGAELGAVVLNFRIVQLPLAVQHYVITHALAHFDASGHDKGFYQKLGYMLPSFEQLQKQLTEYNFLLEVL